MSYRLRRLQHSFSLSRAFATMLVCKTGRSSAKCSPIILEETSSCSPLEVIVGEQHSGSESSFSHLAHQFFGRRLCSSVPACQNFTTGAHAILAHQDILGGWRVGVFEVFLKVSQVDEFQSCFDFRGRTGQGSRLISGGGLRAPCIF